MSKSHSEPVIDIIPGTLHATRNEQPLNRHAIHVSLEAEVEVDWKVKLVRAAPQGFNPLSLLLRFDVLLPNGPHSDAIAKRTITYEESPAGEPYTEVTVENGPKTSSAKVHVVV